MTDKRILKQQYRDTTARAGVYAIRNLASGRMLVAGSSNVEAALNRHRFELRQGCHRNALLRRDWALHGEAGFSFAVLDMLEPREEAGFDPARELDELVAVWRAELPCQGEQGYQPVSGAA